MGLMDETTGSVRTPEYVKDGRLVDRLGRTVLHQLGAVALLRGIPGFADQFKEIPAGCVDEDRVACPCGETVMLEPNGIAGCGTCDRVYLGAKGRAWVGHRDREPDSDDGQAADGHARTPEGDHLA